LPSAKPLQARLSRSLDVLRAAVRARATLASFGIDIEPEFRGNHNLFADRLQCFSDQLLVRERPVSLGRVEEGNSILVS
jgi:hypothetical protein